MLGSWGSDGEGPSRAFSTRADLPAATAAMRLLARTRVGAEGSMVARRRWTRAGWSEWRWTGRGLQSEPTHGGMPSHYMQSWTRGPGLVISMLGVWC